MLATVLSCAAAVPAQTPAREASADTADTKPALIELNFTQTLELKTLIDYVSKRLNINIIYDENIGNNRISLTTPSKVTEAQLLALLKNALKMSNLELVDTAEPGWKAVGRKSVVEFVPVKHVGVMDLAKRAGAILQERERVGGETRMVTRVTGPRAAPMPAGAEVTLVGDVKTRQIAVIGTTSGVREAIKLLAGLDVPGDVQTRTYRFKHVSPKRIDGILKARSDHEEGAVYDATVDEPTGLLIVKAPADVHQQIAELAALLDIEDQPDKDQLQFYKLYNTTVTEVLNTIRSLQTGQAVAANGNGSVSGDLVRRESFLPVEPSGANQPSTPGTGELPPPPSYKPSDSPKEAAATQPSGNGSVMTVLAQNAMVTADVNTNTLIVVAPPAVQKVYRQLISALDKRRPQVLVQVMLVTVNTTDNFSLGVELSAVRFNSDSTLLLFNSFGLSAINPATGLPAINPAQGFNGVLLAPDVLNMVVQALQTHSRSRVLAAPKVLMNDNATGVLASVAEQPFVSINATNTVSTTSFAGYASRAPR